jgi:hypothetical protein
LTKLEDDFLTEFFIIVWRVCGNPCLNSFGHACSCMIALQAKRKEEEKEKENNIHKYR